MSIYSNSINISLKLIKQFQHLSGDEEQTVVQPWNWVLYSNKKEQRTVAHNMDKSQRQYAK